MTSGSLPSSFLASGGQVFSADFTSPISFFLTFCAGSTGLFRSCLGPLVAELRAVGVCRGVGSLEKYRKVGGKKLRSCVVDFGALWRPNRWRYGAKTKVLSNETLSLDSENVLGFELRLAVA